MLVVALALGSSACYGVSNFLGPQLARRHTLASVLVVSQLAALAVCVAYVLADSGRALPAADVWLALLAGAANAGGLIGFYKAAELGPLSVVAPIGAIGAIVPVAWGLSNGEALDAPQVIGIVLALGGAALAARGPRGRAVRDADPELSDNDRPYTQADDGQLLAHGEPRSPDTRHAPHDLRASVLWASASAAAFGVFLTALPKASSHGRAWALLDARIALVLLLVVWARRNLSAIRIERTSALLAVPGLLLVTGTLMYTVAADRGQLSIASVLGSLFPVVTVALGVTLLRERLSRTQTLGVAVALTGIVLIAL